MAFPLQSSRGAIRTRYGPTLFRSKLEADWARCFDHLGVEWRYEHEGRYYGDVFYLPDFFLPCSRQYVEVKGVWTPEDCRKIAALLQHLEPRPHTGLTAPDMPLIAANPDGVFWGYHRQPKTADPLDLATLLLDQNLPVDLLRCRDCRGWWFAVPDWSYRCQCCGACDGARVPIERFSSPLAGWPTHVETWWP